jgi:DNA-directed RNA polymerase specialized sigma24 family protein
MTGNDAERLSQIATNWTLLVRAHHHEGDERHAAFAELLPRYCRAIERYLRRLVGDIDALDLSQEFALRFLRGEFRNADPKRGRFRDYVKASIIYLAKSHQKKSSANVYIGPAPADVPAPSDSDDDAAFRDFWRQELLSRAWSALEQSSKDKGDLKFAILTARADQPDATTEQLAASLSTKLQREISVVNVRQVMHRAREKFAELLRAEVAATLSNVDASAVDEELAELGLLKYFR